MEDPGSTEGDLKEDTEGDTEGDRRRTQRARGGGYRGQSRVICVAPIENASR